MIIFSYLNPSIKRKISNFFRSSHSNFFEANTILNSLKKTGLKISSFDHDASIDIDYKKITHVFGYGNPVFQVISKSLNREIKFVHYLTGSEKNYQNKAEITRVNYFNNKYSAQYKPCRLVNEPHNLEEFYIKKIILIGNKKTLSTYQERINNGAIIKTINATSPIKLNENTKDLINERFFNSEIKKILFISGSGLVHKGLDLVLESIKELNSSKIELHILGPYENDFFNPLKNLVSKPNIIHHGFLNLKSISARKIIESCHFLISPSCSEGQSTSVLAGMTCGLIPILTEECGINIDENFYLLKSLTSSEISQALDSALSLNFKKYKNKSEYSLDLVRKNHQIGNFRDNIEKYLYDFGFHDFKK